MFEAYELRVCDGASGKDVRLEVSGEVDVVAAGHLLDSVLRAASSCERHNLVIVDLANCTFMDSRGVAALIAADRRVRDLCSHLVVTNPQMHIARLLAITGLDGYLDIRSKRVTAPLEP